MKGKITVDVELFATLRERAKKQGDKITLSEGSSLENLFDVLKEKYPGSFTAGINEHVFVINGKKVNPAKIFGLHNKDKVAVFPLIGGG